MAFSRMIWKRAEEGLVVKVKTRIRNSVDTNALKVKVKTKIRNSVNTDALRVTVTTSIRNYNP